MRHLIELGGLVILKATTIIVLRHICRLYLRCLVLWHTFQVHGRHLLKVPDLFRLEGSPNALVHLKQY